MLTPSGDPLQPTFRHRGLSQERDLTILNATLQDKSVAETQDLADCSTRTVLRVRSDNREYLEQRREELSVIAADSMNDEIGDVMGALAVTAKDPSNRSQPQAARVMGELAGVIGNKVHIGDVHNNVANVQVNYSVEDFDAEAHAQAMRQLGIG